MKKLVAIVLTAVLLAMGLGASVANAEVIQEDVFTWITSPS